MVYTGVDPVLVQRQALLTKLGFSVDDPSLSLSDLMRMAADGANVYLASNQVGLPGVFGIDGAGTPYYDPDFTVPAGERAVPQIVDGSVVLVSQGSNYPLMTQAQADVRYPPAASVNLYSVMREAGIDATGVADSTAAIQNALNNNKGVYVPAGQYKISAALLLSSGSQRLVLGAGAVLKPTNVLTKAAVTLSGAGSVLEGPGAITAPAAWDGTNTAWLNSDCQVLITAADCVVKGITINNVYKVGIGARDCSNPTIVDNDIYGNYGGPWTEVETVHFGITIDPGTDGSSGIISRNRVKSCVQGVYVGNIGPGAGHGISIVENTLEECLNHAIYATSDHMIIIGNTSKKTSRAFAIGGYYNIVVANTIYTWGGSTNTNLDKVASIDMRDSIGCLVAFNTIHGELFGTAWAINVAPSVLTTGIKNNIIAYNVVEIDDVSAVGGGIRVGSSNLGTVVTKNQVVNNIIRCKGNVNQAVIWLLGPTDVVAKYNRVENNEVTITSRTYGIYVFNAAYCYVNNNDIYLDFNDTGASVLGGIFLNNVVSSDFTFNKFHCAGKGDFVTWREIWENVSTGCNDNKFENNDFSDVVGSGGANTMVISPVVFTSTRRYVRNNIYSRSAGTKGTFTWTTGTTSFVVNNANVTAESEVLVIPTDSGAGKVMAAPGYYITKQAGVSFTIQTADATTTAQVSNWTYLIF